MARPTSPRLAYVVKTASGGRWVAKFAQAAKDAGWESDAYLPRGEGELEGLLLEAGVSRVVRTEALSSNPLRALRAIPTLNRELARSRPDVVNYFLYRSALVARAATFGIDATRIHSVPGPLFYESRLVRAVELAIGRRDNLVFAGSQATANHAMRLGMPKDRVRIVRFGADFSHFQPAGERLKKSERSALGIPDDGPVFVMVAYWYERKRLGLGGSDVKGHDTVLDAWSRYKMSGGRGQLVLVGGAFRPGGQFYRSTSLDSLGLPVRASIVAVESCSDVRPYYRASDVSISPSRSENYGASAEASAMGLPSIASTAGGLPEIVIPGKTGWLFPPGDAEALAKCMTEAETAYFSTGLKELASEARRRTMRLLDWDVILEEYLAHLDSVIS